MIWIIFGKKFQLFAGGRSGNIGASEISTRERDLNHIEMFGTGLEFWSDDYFKDRSDDKNRFGGP